jgi:hypothetical protein
MDKVKSSLTGTVQTENHSTLLSTVDISQEIKNT